MANNPLWICPECGQVICHCRSRQAANALAKIGTGIMDIDITAGRRRVASLRHFQRTAFIEYKHFNETMGHGQILALKDLTGEITTIEQRRFHQRAFVLQELENGHYQLSTFSKGLDVDTVDLIPIVLDSELSNCMHAVENWIHCGEF